MSKEVVYCVRKGDDVKFISPRDPESVLDLPYRCLATHSDRDFERELCELLFLNGGKDDLPGIWINIRELKHGCWTHELYLECLTYGI